MQGHRRRRATQRSPATPISPKGGGGTASISLSLATNVTVFMERDTKPGEGVSSLSAGELWTPRWRLLISVIH